ncbi:MAG: hypothetical protein WCM93_17200, partial [Bacteroidota bacterium]
CCDLCPSKLRVATMRDMDRVTLSRTANLNLFSTFELFYQTPHVTTFLPFFNPLAQHRNNIE